MFHSRRVQRALTLVSIPPGTTFLFRMNGNALATLCLNGPRQRRRSKALKPLRRRSVRHVLQTAAGANEASLSHSGLRSRMCTLAHAQRRGLQTAAGASESLLSNPVNRSCVHLTPVRGTEAMHASAPFRSHRRLSAEHGAEQAPCRAALVVCSARATDSRRCDRSRYE